MTTKDNKKTMLIYEGPEEPELTENPNIPSPLWRDTSGETPVLKMHNADHSAWIAAAPNLLQSSDTIDIDGATGVTIDSPSGNVAVTAGDPSDPLSIRNVRLWASDEVWVRAEGNDGTGITVNAVNGGVNVNAMSAVTLNASTGAIDIDGADGVTIDSPSIIDISGSGVYLTASEGETGGDIRLDNDGGNKVYVYNDQITISSGIVGTAGTLELVTIDNGGGVAGKIVANASGIDLMNGVEIQAEVTADGFKINTTDPTGIFHIGAMPESGLAGQLVVDTGDSFKLKVCTVAGTPGTWVIVGTQA